MTSLATGFQKVDSAQNPDTLIQCLNAIRNSPFFRMVKEDSFQLLELKSGEILLEIGCGTGADLIYFSSGKTNAGMIVGSDVSRTILREADDSGNISLVQMDGRYLAIRDFTCDAVREDRVLQHVRSPELVIQEMFRVLKPGGRAVLFEPDWETFVIDGISDELTRTILHFWSDQFSSGHIGRKLKRLCRMTGFTEITVTPRTLLLTSLNEAETIFTVSDNARMAAENGSINHEDAERFILDLIKKDCEGDFFSSFTGYLVSCVRPYG